MTHHECPSKFSIDTKVQELASEKALSKPHRRRKRVRCFLKGMSNVFSCSIRSSHDTLSNTAIEDLKRASPSPPQLSLVLPSSTDLTLSPTPSPIVRLVSLQMMAQERREQNAKLPISILPIEVLTEVFAMVCFSEVQASNSARRGRTTPLTLIKVSSRWRDIVLSTPHLWSWVLIRLYKSRYHRQLDIIKDWLGRTTQSQNLTIELSFEDEDAWVNEPPEDLLNILLEQSHRWRSIDLTLPEACYQVIKTSKATFPTLQNIALQPLLADAHVAQSDRKRLDVFSVIPTLSQLRLNGYYLDDCVVPWAQLQELVLQHVYVDECFFALDKASNLVSCTLSTMLLNDCHRAVTKRKLVLPKLEYLKMQGSSGADQGLLLSHITAPSLSEFVLSSSDAAVAFGDVPEMVARSGCLLRTFELHGLELVEAKVLELLRDLPTIETLRINPETSDLGNAFLVYLSDNGPLSDNPSFTSPSLSPIATTTTTTPFLPNLWCLEYDGKAAFDEEVLVRMIKFRCEGNGGDSRGGVGAGGSTAFLRKLEVLKLCVDKPFSAECKRLLDGLSGRYVSSNR